MKPVFLFVLGLVLFCGCLKNDLVEVEVVGVHERVETRWYTRSAHLTVERIDTGERFLLMSQTLGTTGDVFKVRERYLTN